MKVDKGLVFHTGPIFHSEIFHSGSPRRDAAPPPLVLRSCACLQSPRLARRGGVLRNAAYLPSQAAAAPGRRSSPRENVAPWRECRSRPSRLATDRTSAEWTELEFGNGKMIVSRSDGHKRPGTSCLKRLWSLYALSSIRPNREIPTDKKWCLPVLGNSLKERAI